MSKHLRLLVFLASLFLLTVVVATSAWAYDSYGTVSDITLNGMTYYDIYSGAVTNRTDLGTQTQFLQDVVKNRNNLQNWLVLGHAVLSDELSQTSHLSNMAADCAANLSYANSLQAAEFAARDQISDHFDSVGPDKITGIEAWQNDSTTQPVFYGYSFYKDRDAPGTFDYHYYYRGIAFYDFQISLLSDPSLQYKTAAEGYDSLESAAADGAPGVTYESTDSAGGGFVGGVSNYSIEPVTASQNLSDTSSESLSNAIQNSTSYTFTEMIGIETTFKETIPLFGGMEEKLTFQFTAQQAYSTAYTTEHSVENSRTLAYNVEVTLPAHTTIIMKQHDSETKVTLSYDSPVVIKYKVAVYALHGQVYDDGASIHHPHDMSVYLATFGKSDVDNASAVANLTNRIKFYASVPGYETAYGDGLDWDTIYTNGSATDKAAIDWLTTDMPMSVTGASISADYKSVGSEIYGLQPLYALRRVASSTDELKMNSGDYLYVANLPVQGFNAYNVPYYGFDSDWGSWILLDSAGNPIGGANSVASLVIDPVTGKTRLVAGDTAGTVYLKYLIDEDKYSTATNPTTYATNATLWGTAVIKVDVSEKAFDGSLVLAGSVTGYAGDPPLDLDALSTVSVIVYDATGKEVEHPVVWESQEVPSKGITVVNNQLTLTKTGTFHVRVRCGDKYFSWIEVTSLAARQLCSLGIADTTDPLTLGTWDLKNGDGALDLSRLTVSAFDQYGSPWSDLSGLQWSCSPATGTSISGSTLNVSQTGTYTVNAAIGSVQSNGLQLTVVDTTPPAAPTDTSAQLQAGLSVLLSFTDNSTVETGFVIQRQDNGGPWTQIATPGANSGTGAVTYTDSNVVAGHTYIYQVASARAAILSAWSATATIIVPAPPTAPSAMTAILQGSTVALSFVDNSADETGFVIQRNDNNAGWVQFDSLAAAAGTGTTGTDTDSTVVVGHTYQYRVAAVNGFVQSVWSNTATVATVSPPAAPTSLTISLRSGPQVVLSWRDNASNETGFAVERADDGGPFVQIATRPSRLGTGTVSYADTTPLSGHSYSYRVVAIRSLVFSSYSNTATAVVPAPPAAPSNVTVSAARMFTGDQVTIRWTRNSTNNTGFTIQRATNSTFTAGLTTYKVGATTTTYTQTTNRGMTYYYRVAANGTYGSSAWVTATPFPIVTP